MSAAPPAIDALVEEMRACRLCADEMSHAPRPIFQLGHRARIGIFGQAPGKRAHESGRPFTDPSGVRLREWLQVSEEEFYDPALFAIIPMGFCFPGYDERGADLPPLKRCAETWRARVMDAAPAFDLVVLVGGYAQRWHLGPGAARAGLTRTVADWREAPAPYVPLPHPSWRNNGWLKRNPWFESELLPTLRARVDAALKG